MVECNRQENEDENSQTEMQSIGNAQRITRKTNSPVIDKYDRDCIPSQL